MEKLLYMGQHNDFYLQIGNKFLWLHNRYRFYSLLPLEQLVQELKNEMICVKKVQFHITGKMNLT